MSPEIIVRENLARIRERMARAAESVGRDVNDVELIAVTKYVDADAARLVVEAGCSALGESRPQALWSKASELADADIRWHLIGHLQRNKTRRTLPVTSVIHSGDSLRLLESINTISGGLNRVTNVLIEVNISQDASKHGFAPGDVQAALPHIATMANIQVIGLMGMASRQGGLEDARREFASLQKLRDQLRGDHPENISLDELSMGMSGDFEQAIYEGATKVRVGSALFEGLR